jgi:hypothetical protein
MAGTSRRGRLALAAVLLATATFVAATPSPSLGAPGDPTAPSQDATLSDALDAASRGYLDAQNAAEVSRKRQLDLTRQLETTQSRLAVLTAEVNQMAAAAYRSGAVGTTSALLHSLSPASFLERATMIEMVAARNDHELRELGQARAQLTSAKAAIDAELAKQQEQLATMAKKKQDAERALAAVGGKAAGGFVSVTSPAAKPAPRAADGSWPPERCIIADPTTTGCITARTLNALQQAQAAGFTRYVSCYRAGDQYEHPKGRACDFAAQQTGFGGVATGGDRTYGNNLAAYFVRNADALGVLYVIWFKQIWMPATGWRAYNSGRGDPGSDHTNHVHVSLY